MLLDYQKLEINVATRDGLPSAIRPTLLEQTKSDWKNHPRFAGKASFFMKIHRQLLDGADWLATTSEQLLDTPPSELSGQINTAGLVSHAEHLLQFAHRHHEIEDHGYFPQFIRLYPQLEHAMGLLDGDHQVLDKALNGVEVAIATLQQPNRDAIAGLYRNASALKKIMHRHITDEEEVIIPIFLRHG